MVMYTSIQITGLVSSHIGHG